MCLVETTCNAADNRSCRPFRASLLKVCSVHLSHQRRPLEMQNVRPRPSAAGGIMSSNSDVHLVPQEVTFFFLKKNHFLACYLEQGSLQMMMLTEGPQDEIVYTLVSSEEERTHKQTESRIPCEIGGRDRSNTSRSQRALGTASSHQQPGERPGTDSPAASVSVEGTNPADVSIQNCEGRDFCCFKSPRMWRFVKIAGKPIRLLNQNPHLHESPGDSCAHRR